MFAPKAPPEVGVRWFADFREELPIASHAIGIQMNSNQLLPSRSHIPWRPTDCSPADPTFPGDQPIALQPIPHSLETNRLLSSRSHIPWRPTDCSPADPAFREEQPIALQPIIGVLESNALVDSRCWMSRRSTKRSPGINGIHGEQSTEALRENCHGAETARARHFTPQGRRVMAKSDRLINRSNRTELDRKSFAIIMFALARRAPSLYLPRRARGVRSVVAAFRACGVRADLFF